MFFEVKFHYNLRAIGKLFLFGRCIFIPFAAKRLLCRITLSPFHAGYRGMLAQNAVP